MIKILLTPFVLRDELQHEPVLGQVVVPEVVLHLADDVPVERGHVLARLLGVRVHGTAQVTNLNSETVNEKVLRKTEIRFTICSIGASPADPLAALVFPLPRPVRAPRRAARLRRGPAGAGRREASGSFSGVGHLMGLRLPPPWSLLAFVLVARILSRMEDMRKEGRDLVI